jgi:hypothetical protein
MPIPYQHVEITLEGLSELDTPIARPVGKLDIAENVEVVDTKALRKRRGYRFVDLAEAVNIFDTDAVYTRVVSYNGRLVIFSYSYVIELGSRAGAMRGSDTVVYRGPANRGNGGIRSVAVSRTSQNTQT